MRCLFVTSPGQGHVQPLLGLARALVEAGHAVGWAVGEDGLAGPRALGLDTLTCGPAFDMAMQCMRTQHPDVMALPGRAHAGRGFALLFGRQIGLAMWPSLRRAGEAWRPDLVVSEPGALAAPLLARHLGVRQVTHEFGLALPGEILAGAAEIMAPAWEALGLEVPADAGVYAQGVIEIAPPSLRRAHTQPATAPRRWSQRPAALPALGMPGPGADLQAFVGASGGRPLVAVGFGTLPGGQDRWAALMQAIGGLDAWFVVALGPREAAPDLPGNVHCARYVPYDWLLPQCRAMVSHAGAGSLLMGLTHGLPQVLLPFGADQYRNADALARCGAARVFEGTLDPVALGQGVEAAIADPAMRDAADRLQIEIHAMPTAAQTAFALGRPA